MVSLVDKVRIELDLENSPKVKLFHMFLQGNSIDSIEVPEADLTFKQVLMSLKKNDKKLFTESYETLSARKPSMRTPLVYDNPLLFSIICGVVKYGLKQYWIDSILTLRSQSDSNDEIKLISTTLRGILDGNYLDNKNHHATVIVFQSLLGVELLNASFQKKVYKDVCNRKLTHDAPFFNLIEMAAFDVIIDRHDVLEEGDIMRLLEIEKVFLRRARLVSNIIQWTVIIGVYLGIILAYFFNPSFNSFLKENGIIFTSLGISSMGLLFWQRNFISNAINNLIQLFWGYKKK